MLAAVEQAIAELNYVPNRAARSLASAAHACRSRWSSPRTRTASSATRSSPTSSRASRDRLDDTDYVLNLQLIATPSRREKTRRYLLGGNVDGAIVVSHHSGDHFLASLAGSLPVVFGGRPIATSRRQRLLRRRRQPAGRRTRRPST